MRSILRYIVILTASVLVLSSCGKDEAEVIPRAKLAKIYAEMLVTDQWVTSTPGVRMIADTSLVYEPILEKYGYDIEDYLLSVDNYMNDPERFSRILRTSGEIIEKRLKELRKQQHILELIANLPKIESDFKPQEYFTYLFDEPYVHYYDSLGVEIDSLKWDYRFVPIETADTIYDRIRMIIRDTLPPVDSLAPADSLALADSLASPDSILNAIDKKIVTLDVKKDTAELLKESMRKFVRPSRNEGNVFPRKVEGAKLEETDVLKTNEK